MDKDQDNIQVIVRVRSLNERERNEGSRSCVTLNNENNNILILDSKPERKVFYFDYVGGEKLTQTELYGLVGRPLLTAAIEGYNICIFAYGQTGAGKTYTMLGDPMNDVHKGLQPRVFEEIFAMANDFGKTTSSDFLFKCNFYEIYNEQIIDLLTQNNNNLQLREDHRRGPYIEGITEEIVTNPEELGQVLIKGNQNRHIGSTSMNSESSRSHSVFTLFVESKKIHNGVTNIKQSRINFVDLAGSERQKQTNAIGERLKEATNINKSLTVLGCVINSLVEASQGKNRHIPYRDSKLTFILKDSLGGNSKTCMIAAVSSASGSFAETLSTLKFAQRAKMIKNRALINEEASSGNEELYKREIRRLKDELVKSANLINELQLKAIEHGPANIANVYQEAKLTPNFEVYLQKTMSRQKSLKKLNFTDQITKFSIEMETNFTIFTEKIKENLFAIQERVFKKEEGSHYFYDVITKFAKNEVNYHFVISLYKNRIERLTRTNQFLKEEECVYDFKDESRSLYEIINNYNSIWALIKFLEKKKSKNKKSLLLTENINLFEKLLELIEELKIENGKWNKDPSNQDSLMSKFKSDYMQKIILLNEENMSLKSKNAQVQQLYEVEIRKNEELLKIHKRLEEKLSFKSQENENKLTEIVRRFSSSANKNDLSEIDLNVPLIQDFRMFELEASLQTKISTMQMMEIQLNEQKSLVETLNEQKISFERELYESNDEKIKNELHLQKEIELLREELHLKQLNFENLEIEVKARLISLEEIKKEKMNLENDVMKITEENKSEIISLKNSLEKEKNSNDRLEMEKKKLQEDYDTLMQTYNYEKEESDFLKTNNNNNQSILQELNQSLIESNSKIAELEIFIKDIQSKYSNECFEKNMLSAALTTTETLNQKIVIQIENLTKNLTEKELQCESLKRTLEEAKSRNDEEKAIFQTEIINLKDKEIDQLKLVLRNSNEQINEALLSLNNLQTFLIFSAEKLELTQNENESLKKEKEFLGIKSKELDQFNHSLNDRLLQISHRYEILSANYKLLNNESLKMREEIKVAELEKENDAILIRKLDEEKKRMVQMNDALKMKISSLERDLDDINKQNTSLIGHNNPEQKIKHITKLKEENNKLKEEKMKLINELECLKKFEGRTKSKESLKFATSSVCFDGLEQELEKEKLRRINEQMNVGIHKIAEIFNFVTLNSNTVEECEINELINKIILSNKEKFDNLQEKERIISILDSKLNLCKIDFNIMKKRNELRKTDLSPNRLSVFNSSYKENRIPDDDLKLFEILESTQKKNHERRNRELSFSNINEVHLKRLKFEILQNKKN